MGLQTLISAIDPKTGEKTIDPKLVLDRNHAVTVCPHGGGGRNWMPTAYNPQTKMLYIPAQETCMELAPAGPGERGFLSTGVMLSLHPRPDSNGRFGRLQAISLDQRKTVWNDRRRAFQSGGVLATGGGLAFAAATDRWFSAYDDATGGILWRARLSDIPNAPPITYSVKGRQYIAIVVGNGESAPSVYTVLTPEIPLPIARSSSLWVFSLSGEAENCAGCLSESRAEHAAAEQWLRTRTYQRFVPLRRRRCQYITICKYPPPVHCISSLEGQALDSTH